jgi:hypothetical protein
LIKLLELDVSDSERIPPIEWLPNEEWRQTHVPGYYVSDRGRLYSYRSKKLLKPWFTSRAIKTVQLAGVIMPLAAVLWRAFRPDEEPPAKISYIDGDSDNVTLENIEKYIHKGRPVGSLNDPNRHCKTYNMNMEDDEPLGIEELLASVEENDPFEAEEPLSEGADKPDEEKPLTYEELKLREEAAREEWKKKKPNILKSLNKALMR